MGAANKMDPTRFQIADISKTHTDPIAKVIRTRLRKEGIKKGIPVVFSDESPIVIREDIRKEVGKENAEIRKAQMPPSSNAFVPSVAGLIMASYVVRQLLSDIKISTVRDAKRRLKMGVFCCQAPKKTLDPIFYIWRKRLNYDWNCETK